MKRLLLSLFMVQGLWGAAAADMPDLVTVQTKDKEKLQIPFGIAKIIKQDTFLIKLQ